MLGSGRSGTPGRVGTETDDLMIHKSHGDPGYVNPAGRGRCRMIGMGMCREGDSGRTGGMRGINHGGEGGGKWADEMGVDGSREVWEVSECF